jgi:hypothetical protein
VPFKGRLEGLVTETPVLGGPSTLVDVLVVARGNASHLGKFALTVPYRLDRSTTPPTVAGFYLFTAANGDTLSASFAGQVKTTPTPGVFAIVETATITGGTGQFGGSTGSFVCERLFNTVTRTTTGSFNATTSWLGPLDQSD